MQNILLQAVSWHYMYFGEMSTKFNVNKTGFFDNSFSWSGVEVKFEPSPSNLQIPEKLIKQPI